METPVPFLCLIAVNAIIQRAIPNDPHPGRDAIAIAQRKPTGSGYCALFGQRQGGGDTGGLYPGEVFGRFLEIALRPGFNPVGTDASLRDIEIFFHDAALSPQIFNEESEIGFEPFAQIATALPQEDILCGLLADG